MTKNSYLFKMQRLNTVDVVSFCLERQWTAPEMPVHCIVAASAVTVESNS